MMIQDDSDYMPGPGGMAAMVWQQLIDRRAAGIVGGDPYALVASEPTSSGRFFGGAMSDSSIA
ncbi:hypothetical protein PENSUB_4697 [Penicillium subrubescens]|uniref:Uncharacterized protein n=1 Tax=Penicillium subrubescens TaxID=1316194 RepID=A0A1Q5UR42_9EURO|nr:hypothetical protein PENSUB_4697 [Penicillium subrubescens]